LPVAEGVVLAGFTGADLLAAKGLFDPRRTLAGDLEAGEALGGALAALRRRRFRFAFEEATVRRLRALLQPQIHFLDPREEPHPAPASPERIGFFLDRKQERMARVLASPRTLVYGPAGSGKTVFLVARARYWMDRKPGSRILFTCYNSSLASHLRNEFLTRGVRPDDRRLSVIHYHDLCRRMLDMGPDFHEMPPEFYAVLEPKVLRKLAGEEAPPTYDLILVDEGQDFTRRMIEVLVRLVRPGGEITVVSDPAQDLYGRWREENLTPLGTYAVERLVDCYRNTAPIFALALAVLSETTRETMGLNRLELTRPEDLGREGPAPELVRLADLDALTGLILDRAAEARAAGRPLSELAVLYTNRKALPRFAERLARSRWGESDPGRFRDPAVAETPSPGVTGTLEERREEAGGAIGAAHFAEALERELVRRNLPAEWVARDFATKSAYDISSDRITLSTVHSAKGMDFHTVILLGAETLPLGSGEPDPHAAALLFTGITRARERVVLPYFDPTGWIPALEERLEDLAHDAGS